MPRDEAPRECGSSIVVADPVSLAASVEATARLIVWGVRPLAEHGGLGSLPGSLTPCHAAGESAMT